MFKRSLWLTASLPLLAAARNCTVRSIPSDEAVGWQPGGCYRGTWNIVSTCLSTIIACTWSIQHPNIPATDDGTWEKTKRKIKWMIITVLFPELVMIHAMFEFHMAWKALRLMSEKQKPVEWPWWFRKPSLSWLPCCRQNLKDKDPESQGVKGPLKKWTLAHCYFANMGGFIYIGGEKPFPVTAQQLAEDSSYMYPEITVEDIEDKCKQDWLAKIFAALQILQLILSIITRHVQGVQFSQLETVTLSFAICGVLIYYTYFHKPQKIERPVELKYATSPSNDVSQKEANGTQTIVANDESQEKSTSTQKTALRSSLQFKRTYDSFWAVMLNKHSPANGTDSLKCQKAFRIPNDNIPLYEGNNDVHPAVYLLALASGLFGAIHAIAWHFEFPTELEKLLWHIATGISAASPVIGLLAIPLAQFTKSAGDPELFMGNCLRLMQECSWHSTNKFPVKEAMKELEDTFVKSNPKAYSTIFSAGETGESTLILDLRDFLDLTGDFAYLDTKPFDLHDDEWFILNFHRLVGALNGTQTKKINDAARTNTWPRRPLLPRGVNRGVLYITGFLYCASRLILLGVSLSSIRKMPGSVYIETNWTQYMPAFGASGG